MKLSCRKTTIRGRSKGEFLVFSTAALQWSPGTANAQGGLCSAVSKVKIPSSP